MEALFFIIFKSLLISVQHKVFLRYQRMHDSYVYAHVLQSDISANDRLQRWQWLHKVMAPSEGVAFLVCEVHLGMTVQ